MGFSVGADQAGDGDGDGDGGAEGLGLVGWGVCGLAVPATHRTPSPIGAAALLPKGAAECLYRLFLSSLVSCLAAALSFIFG